MIRHAISDADWLRLEPLLPGRPGTPGRSGDDNRRFLHAVNWIARTGAPWRDLPDELGHWNTAWRRYDRWCANGVWLRIMDHFQDPDLDWVLIDSTIVRAHQHAAGARKRGLPPKRPPHARASAAAAVG